MRFLEGNDNITMEELDLVELFELFWRKKFLIIALVVIAAIIGVIYTYNFVKPKYEAYTKIVLAQVSDIGEEESVKNTTGINTNDITLNQKLVSTYSELIKSASVLNMVKDELKLNDSLDSIKKSINVTAVADTQVIQITVRDANPVKARDIANQIAKVFPEKVQEYYSINNVSILDEATIAETPYNIHHIRDIAIFALGGLVIAVAIILVLNMLDNTVGSVKEIENALDINVLASIPECEQDIKQKKGEKKHGK